MEVAEQPVFHQDPLPPSAIEYQKKQANGMAMDRLSIKRESAIEAARIAGIVPFSILNFNPVVVNVESGVVNVKVPPYQSPLGIKKKVKFGGIERIASLVVIANPEGYAKILRASNEQGGDPNSPDVDWDWRVVLPMEQARLFEFQYNDPNNPAAMGGIIVFKGDAHALESKDGIIHVPHTKRLKNGAMQHFTQPIAFVDKLNEVLARQKQFCINKLQQAKQFYNDPELRKSVDNIHQVWGQFASDLGWQDIGRMDFLLPRDGDESCPKCGKMRESGAAMFCPCGRPYNPFEAFMAGEDVATSYLANLPDEQLAEVKAEMKRRRELFEEEETVQAKGKK